MADSVWARISIGGVISRAKLGDLLAAIAVDLGEDEDSEVFENFPLRLLEDGALVVAEEDMMNGEFEHTEKTCRALELTYYRQAHGCAAWGPEEVWWDPTCDADAVKIHDLDCDGGVIIPVDAVSLLLQAYMSSVEETEAGRRLADGLTKLIDEWDEVPDLEIVED